MSTVEKDRRGIQSIEVGGTLLQALVRNGAPMMLRDLAKEAGMPPAKAHPYLVSFGKLGLIEQDALTGRYGLGPFALQMGLAALHGVDPLRVALTEIAPLADEIQLNVAVAVWGNHGPTIVRIEECSKPIHVNMRPGTVMTPLMASATGRLFAAFLPDRITRPIIEAELSRLVLTDQPAPRASRKLADEMLAEVRRHGLARALGNPIPGINAFSAPVFDSGGNIALCITAMGPAGTFETEWDSPTASKLLGCAQEISRRLGFAARQA
ncbi:MAG: IclR family transcriptional regulator [Rhodocyclaceae bacterium]|nr:IclR family transcriptional regulator [Rhodocyclaceae bacterium]MCP5233968.1 IclR family transcriptional regulator [Zoogloeaceae bacterium]MCB1913171.1 IclR family transcriptional regulator [Rhodocyclaceae bacterium]MCP5240680.1 IclR family transcriptional regulator [Zoogloeaceae bacterium]MCP5253208.1 IclR family transcriptional regulator [Zoogloeaceae bacterium]